MTSSEVRKLVASGELSSEQAVDQLLKHGSHTMYQDAVCPECGATFYCSPLDREDSTKLGHMNTCSTACQIAWNTAIMEIDGGRTIHRVQDVTKERLNELLGDVGLGISNSKKVTPS
jgi:hypothetical protein